MDLTCVNCGALIADQDAACAACGIPRDASLPPGSRSAGPTTAVLRAPLVIPTQRQWVEPPRAPAYVGRRSAAHLQPGPAAKSPIGVSDVAVTLISVAVAFGLGWLVHGDLNGVQHWMLLRSVFGIDQPWELNGHDVLVMLVTFSPLAVAVLAASISRVPGTGVLVAAASFAALAIDGNGPRVIGHAPEFDLNRDWVVVVVLAGFAVADVILAFAGREALTGLLVGALTGIVSAGFVVLYVQRIDSLQIFDEAWLIVVLVVVPTLLLLVAGLVGGAIGGLRRR